MILAVHENVSMELYVKKSTRLILNVYVVRVIMDLFAKTVIQVVELEILKSQLFNFISIYLDVDECENIDACPENSVCRNSVGSYEC